MIRPEDVAEGNTITCVVHRSPNLLQFPGCWILRAGGTVVLSTNENRLGHVLDVIGSDTDVR